jgi:hypothetical protein
MKLCQAIRAGLRNFEVISGAVISELYKDSDEYREELY